MPGPRAKQNAAKKHKHKVMSQGNAASSPAIPIHVLKTLGELSNDDWDKVVKVLCDHFKLPDLTTKSGLKKVYHNFNEIYKRIDDTYVAYEGNQLIQGGIVAIYVKMCVDSILRNMLFHQEGLLAKIIALIEKPNSRHLALRALTTVTQHGGSDIRKEISLQAPIMIKVLQDFPDDLYAAELAISTIAHAVTSLDEPQRPSAKYVKALHLSKLIPLILGIVSKPGVSLPLLHHTLDLFGYLTHYCSQECLVFPDMIDFLIACIRSADMHSRFYALGAVVRLNTPGPEKLVGDPGALLAAVQRGLPGHLNKLLVDYGPARCESTLTIRSFVEYQKAMMQCLQDHDLYKLGLTLAELIPRNEFAISEGGFQAINERTGRVEFMDVGLPFKMWVDALPICAKVIRERGKSGEEELADMLDMKYFVIRSRVPEAIVLAKEGIERNPKSPYPYYIMTLGDNAEAGLRYAKKGLKCKNVTPFVNHALWARATEIAGNLSLCRMQESAVGDQKWEQGQAFLSSALDDAQVYLTQAPPDMRHRKSILYWYIVLSLAEKGPELSTDLHELKVYTDSLKIADEFFAEFGVVAPKSQLRFAHERIFSRYATAAKKWSAVVARLDSHSIDKYILSRDKAEDRLAVWLHNIHDENGDDIDDDRPDRPSHRKQSKNNPTELHQCSWCRNPSAVLRKCGGCEKARYCDTSCQKLAWSEHKPECKSHKTASLSV
ncbi:hypothetical protein J3R83DRAFT_12474 [Lanmaoa asiatica]|nr:hypothetical protein J3R83DRAFT_12474 [Lanmaoa asiatica]